jgi:AAA ATPase containing von Willebrand factor type A (vWA) domain
MSQRLRETLARKGLLARPQIIGWDRLHRPIWSVAGGSVTDPGDSGADDNPDDDAPDDDAPDDNPDDADDNPDDAGDDDKDKPKDRRSADAERRKREQEEEKRKSRAKIAAADRRAAEAERRYREAKAELDKDRPEVERVRGELAEAESNVSRLTQVNRDLALQVAFFRNSKVDWVDPSDAMYIAMRELSDLEVDEDGSTDDAEVQKVIARMVKEKGHLVRRSQPKSGAGVGGSKKGQDNGAANADQARIAGMFPAVKGRVLQQTPPQ